VKDKKAVLEESISLSATIYKDKKGYEAKNLSVTIKEEKGKKGTSLAKTVIDIAEFVGSKEEQKRTFSLKPKKGKTPVTLVLVVRTKESEMAPDEDATETENISATDLSDDEEDVEDFQDDNKEESKSSRSSSSFSKDTPKKDALKVETPSKDSPGTKRDSAKLEKNASSSSLNSNAEIEDLRGELEKATKRESDLKKRVKELATDNVDQEEQIKELTRELEESKKRASSNNNSPAVVSSPSNDKEVTDLKKRVKELANENVDMEEEMTDLKNQIEQLKKEKESSNSKPPPVSSKEVEANAKVEELKKRIQEIETASKEKETIIANQKVDIDRLKEKSEKSDKDITDLKKRVKELATENVDLEEESAKMKKQLEDLKKSSSSSAPPTPVATPNNNNNNSAKIEELKKMVQNLGAENDDLEEKVSNQQSEIKQLKRDAQEIEKLRSTALDVDRLKTEIQTLKKERDDRDNQNKERETAVKKVERDNYAKEKDNTVKERDITIEDLRRKLDGVQRERDTFTREREDSADELERLRERVSQLKSTKSELETKLETSTNRESELLQRVRELEETNEKIESTSKSQSAASLTLATREKERDREKEKRERERLERERIDNERKEEKEKLEKDVEKEKESRKKAERELREIKDKLRDLEYQLEDAKRANTNNNSNTNHSNEADPSAEENGAIIASLYSVPAEYGSDDGVPMCAAELLAALSKFKALSENVAFAAKATSALEASILRHSHDMNVLFYWVSTTAALLHLLKDDPEVTSDNDRDPIIDGIHQSQMQPNQNAPLQDQLEWVAFRAYELLVKSICSKLSPLLVKNIIEQSVEASKPAHAKWVHRILNRILHRSREHFLYDAIVQQLFNQTFYFINSHLVNAVLALPRITPSTGFQIKLGLSRLEDWLSLAATHEYERSLLLPASEQLDGLREIANAIVIDKSLFAVVGTIQSIFRVTSLRQIKRIIEVFTPDSLAPSPVPANVKEAVASTWNTPSPNNLPFILDDQQIIPFVPRLT